MIQMETRGRSNKPQKDLQDKFARETAIKENTGEDSDRDSVSSEAMAHQQHTDPMDMVSTNNISGKIAPQVQPEWFREVSQNLYSSIDTVNRKLSSIEEKLTGAQNSAEFASSKAEEAIERAEAAEKLALSLKQQNDRLKHEVTVLKERVIQGEGQSRRNNLLFDGLPESNTNESWQDCENLLVDTLVNKMGIVDGKSIKFERVHRKGQLIPGKQRTVIAAFLSYKDRERVWNNKKVLRNTNIRVSEDFAPEVNNERKVLYPIYKKALTMESMKPVRLKVNKLYINNREFTCKNLNELPTPLKPENLFTQRKNGITLFSSRNSLLSNLYSEVEITIDGQIYASTEQYIQHKKALFFTDDVRASNIMCETDPYKLVSLGHKIKGANELEWLPEARKVIFKANVAKFTQVTAARDALIATGNDILGEATMNVTYGIGKRMNDPSAFDPSLWTKNIFGNILQEVRTHISKNLDTVP